MLPRLALLMLVFSASVLSHAQDCKSNLYMTPNAKIVMAIYDKKGAQTGVQTIQVTNVSNAGGTYQSTVSTSMADSKGKVIGNSSGVYKCSGGMFSADLKMFMPQEGAAKTSTGDAKMEPVYLEYPATLSMGQKLQDAQMKLEMNNSGMQTSIDFKEEGRTVTAQESVTSPAGTWNAYVISYNGSMKTKISIISGPTFNFSVKEWFVPGMGVVKSETYLKGGKLAGSTMLTAVSK